MTYQYLLIHQENNIITLTVNRPKALNAINKTVMLELDDFFSKTYKDISGIIITGAGDRAFVAGADITEFSSYSSEEGKVLAKKGHDTFFKIEGYHIPVVALINGYTLGAGNELAMACHMRICTAKSKFGQPEVNLGLCPGYGGSQRLIQYIGKTKATELLLTGAMIDAEEAVRLGLVNYSFETIEEAQEKTYAILKTIGQKGPLAIRKTIELINAHFASERHAFDEEVEDFGFLIGTEDCKEGAAAFVEKRKANFNGN